MHQEEGAHGRAFLRGVNHLSQHFAQIGRDWI
jgi:hypothetical protein